MFARTRLTLALGLALASLAIRGAPAAETTVVPLQVLRTGHITVNVRLNDTGPFRLVLDTGAPFSFISGQAAHRAGFIDAETLAKPGFFGIRGRAKVKRFAVGTVEVKDLDVMILDHPIIEMVAGAEGPIDGIVGFTFFARFRMTLDYAASQVSFAPVDYHPGDVQASLMGRSMGGGPTRKVLATPALWGILVEPTAGDAGVRVTRVFAGGAAAAGGLRVGDRITAIDGRWVGTLVDCYEAAGRVRPGQAAAVAARRGEVDLLLKVQPTAGL